MLRRCVEVGLLGHFNFSYPNEGVVLYHCGFHLQIFGWLKILSIFLLLFGHFYVFGDVFTKTFAHCFIGLFSYYSVLRVHYIFWIQVFCQIHCIANSPSHPCLVFIFLIMSFKEQKVLILMKLNLWIIFLMAHGFLRNLCLSQGHKKVFHVFF